MEKRSWLWDTVSVYLADYGMIVVLLGLCGYYSYATWNEQYPSGQRAARLLADQLLSEEIEEDTVLIVARTSQEDREFSQTLTSLLEARVRHIDVVNGQPADARRAIEDVVKRGKSLDVIAVNHVTQAWAVLQNLDTKFPSLGTPRVVVPASYHWPTFLKTDNLLNVANQIVVIAIIAIGMTLVIITGGIDLSSGSLIALSAVVTMLLMRDYAGAQQATLTAMFLCSLGGVVVCALLGVFSGVMVTQFAIPPFIVTLGMMQVARGLAFILARGESINAAPPSFVWLGRGADILGIPNAVVLMLVLYVMAHGVMTRTVLGRYIYAVGGNVEAARLSGVPVKRVLLLVYTLCGALAGLGGIVTASLLNSGDPKYGETHELFVIAAVVVGGTSLAGGEGKVLGTLIGAFIIAVIQNGMNLTGVESYTQRVVLGMVILGAVLIDTIKKRGKSLLPRQWFRRLHLG